ncbi:MAG: xylanase [Eubacteriales bacterium]|nr:xylanase [Eubacteriales bacterium]
MENSPNLLGALGISQTEIDERVDAVWRVIFTDETERFYFEAGEDAGYLMDTGNLDARTEGMSYGMMMAVQMNRKDFFDRLWTFSIRYMLNDRGPYEGYFAWSVQPDGKNNSDGPAPDGEEYYAMALFFASERWGDGAPPYDYAAQARAILRHALHQHALVPGGHAMWDAETALIKFVPNLPFSDPSYHLPHFYERFALHADEGDRAFWRRAAEASRSYIVRACHPVTGLAPEYALLDGTPETAHGHGDFFSDAYRVAMNIGLDSAWNGPRPAYRAIVDRLQTFLWDREPWMTYTVQGAAREPPALHPIALIATTAAASLATDTPLSHAWVRKFWQTPPRRGERRYYDNCLYFFCLLMLAGRYQPLA